MSKHASGRGHKLLTVAFVLPFLAVTFFLFRWQIIDHQVFVERANQRLQRKTLVGQRGDILARDGSVFAYSEPRFDMYVYMDVDHGLVAAERAGRQSRAEFVAKVSEALGVDAAEIKTKLDNGGLWIELAKKVDKATRDKLLNLASDKDAAINLDGLSAQESSARVYPEGRLGAHVVGFVGEDSAGNEVGAGGLENYFEGLLKSQAGVSSTETDSNDNAISVGERSVKAARRGATIQTTIDKTIQTKVEEMLAASVERYSARSGSIIIMKPTTGEILAMANYPDYEPQRYYAIENSNQLSNISITNPYEIGSVGKIFTMAAAVDQGKVLPNTIVIKGHTGCQKIIEGRVVCTYDKKPQPALTATEAMIKSDNLALFATASLVGERELADYLFAFGLGKRTGVQLSGEDAGFIKPGEEWNEADLATYAYGHSYFQTALQASVGVAALANGGQRMQPMIVSQIIENGEVTKRYQPVVAKQVIKKESAATMAAMLHQVYLYNVNDRNYRDLQNYNIAMKSGTALIPFSSLYEPINKAGYSDEVNSTYVGYDAGANGKFLMLVNLSEPQTTPKLSFNNARILWLDLFREIKEDLGMKAEV